MIVRVWHGWTERANADAYERRLRTEICPGILARSMSGFQAIELPRCDCEDEVEFVTIMRFDSLDAIKDFAGAAYETAMVPPAARALLSRFDSTSRHYGVIDSRRG